MINEEPVCCPNCSCFYARSYAPKPYVPVKYAYHSVSLYFKVKTRKHEVTRQVRMLLCCPKCGLRWGYDVFFPYGVPMEPSRAHYRVERNAAKRKLYEMVRGLTILDVEK